MEEKSPKIKPPYRRGEPKQEKNIGSRTSHNIAYIKLNKKYKCIPSEIK